MPEAGVNAGEESELRLDGYIGSLCVSRGTVSENQYGRLFLEYALAGHANQDHLASGVLNSRG
jgi:hypothetical protein